MGKKQSDQFKIVFFFAVFLTAGLLLSGCNPLVSSPSTQSAFSPGGTHGTPTPTPTPAPTLSSIVLSSAGATTIAANGTSTTSLTALVTDNNGNPMSGISVTLNIPSHGGTSPNATTNPSGVATFTLTSSTKIGIYSYTASASAVTSSSLNITFGGILDLLTASDGAAYSLRLLKASYTGASIQVRRTSDNATSDIGFVNNLLDTATLTTFVGAASGYITIWYDQSGNGFDAVQSSAGYQPQIVSAGSIITLSGLPTIEFGTNPGTNTLLQGLAGSVLTGISSFTANTVANMTGATNDGYGRLIDLQSTTDGTDYSNSTSAVPLVQRSGLLTEIDGYRAPAGFLSHAILSAGSPAIMTSLNDTNTNTVYANGNAGNTATNTGTYALGSTLWINIGNWATGTGTPITGGGNDALVGHESEMIIFPSALSTTDRQTLEHDQESHYSITGI